MKYALQKKNRCKLFCDRWHAGRFNRVDTDVDEEVRMKRDDEKR